MALRLRDSRTHEGRHPRRLSVARGLLVVAFSEDAAARGALGRVRRLLLRHRVLGGRRQRFSLPVDGAVRVRVGLGDAPRCRARRHGSGQRRQGGWREDRAMGRNGAGLLLRGGNGVGLPVAGGRPHVSRGDVDRDGGLVRLPRLERGRKRQESGVVHPPLWRRHRDLLRARTSSQGHVRRQERVALVPVRRGQQHRSHCNGGVENGDARPVGVLD